MLGYTLELGEPILFSIKTILDRIVILFKPALLHKKLHHSIERMPPRPLASLKGHPHLIEKILINLISNAIKFTEPGGRITIEYGLNDRETQLRLVVIDTGIGITKNDQATIFKAFKRLTPAYKTNQYAGTGLGLYSVKKMVALMGGKIEVISQGPGQGAAFICQIPIAVLNTQQECKNPLAIASEIESETGCNPEDAIPLPPIVSPLSHTKKATPSSPCVCKILLVEDVKSIRLITEKLIQQIEPTCQVDQAETMAKAIELTHETHYTLILMDIGLPDGDGKNAAEIIRTHPQSKNHQTPIVAVTAHVDKAGKTACLAAGMQMVIDKPLTIQIVKSLLETYCQNNPFKKLDNPCQ